MSRLPGKQTILISSLCMLCTPAFAQNGSNVKRKIALGPGLAPVAPSVVPKSRRKRLQVQLAWGSSRRSQVLRTRRHICNAVYIISRRASSTRLSSSHRATEQNPRDVRRFTNKQKFSNKAQNQISRISDGTSTGGFAGTPRLEAIWCSFMLKAGTC